MNTARRVALTTCIATLVLIAVGVLVRASGSGLGCPDWPLCHGGVVPPGDQGHEPLIEFSHRFVAGVVGLLVIATAVFAWRYFRHAPVVLWTALITVPLVGLQGLLGAITVWRELPPEIVATHLLTAMIILSLQVVTVLGMYSTGPDSNFVTKTMPAMRSSGRLALGALGYFALLLWIGGYMAESGASTACEGWPLCNGAVVPTFEEHEVTHMLHRYLAAGFILPLAPIALRLFRQRSAYPGAGLLAGAILLLYLMQVLIGALNVWYTFPEPLTILHTVVASWIWFAVSIVAVLGFYSQVPVWSRTPSVRATA